ncbi:DUF6643 family protein [Streptomyces albipurpureus]|uniref:Uncharacterized protein n=1 Tax=Streptomyces albipurpureus TaxID=2897419 RepID=A0ABT0USW9_9ACTN|nr:DUF6643 family protein [Streptomyces sp. CWNU-1]MCM2390715.1 hypothetical protein [Streptomyces sp. CWNU-1]
MTSPRSIYGGGYYSAPSFADTPIYDSLVAERGTPQIAPIRVPAAYDTGSNYLPALPAALPALPAGPSAPQPAYGYGQQTPQPMSLQQAPAPYIPQQQPVAPRGYPGQQGYPQQRPPATGYEAMRPAAPRPAPAPGPGYTDPYNRPYPGQGY